MQVRAVRTNVPWQQQETPSRSCDSASGWSDAERWPAQPRPCRWKPRNVANCGKSCSATDLPQAAYAAAWTAAGNLPAGICIEEIEKRLKA